MQRVAVTVLGRDRPGIVCDVTTILAQADCNIENLSQTVLKQEFAGIFIVAPPEGMPAQEVSDLLSSRLDGTELQISAHPVQEGEETSGFQSEPFVVVCIGEDKVGLISAVTCVMKSYGVNIVNMQFVGQSSSFPGRTVAIYEVDLPRGLSLSEFTGSLRARAEQVGLEVSVQHKRIFSDICRI